MVWTDAIRFRETQRKREGFTISAKGSKPQKTAYEAHGGLPLIYNAEKRLSESLEHFEKAMRIIPNARGFINCAALKTKSHRYTDAITDLKRAIGLDSKNSEAYFGLA